MTDARARFLAALLFASLFFFTLLLLDVPLSASAQDVDAAQTSVPTSTPAPVEVATSLPTEAPTPPPAEAPTEGASSGRQRTHVVEYTEYVWWLNRYQNNEVLCVIVIEHEGLPTPDEVLSFCPQSAYAEYLKTTTCKPPDSPDQPRVCSGTYLYLLSTKTARREVSTGVPTPSARITLSGCMVEPDSSTYRCETLPALSILGDEPLVTERIVAIKGNVAGTPFECADRYCLVTLPPTGAQGIAVDFWAVSSFGDTSPHYTALVRVVQKPAELTTLVPAGSAPSAPSDSSGSYHRGWLADVLSEQWIGEPPASCALSWGAFPQVGGPPTWLSSPKNLEELRSDVAYYFLAAALIRTGQVDAGGCPDGGYATPFTASACGLRSAYTAVQNWQNQFDPEIMRAAKNYRIPARLIKNLFIRESQFWPGVYTKYDEAGLGQMTEGGADMVLMWNPDFYRSFCPTVINRWVCDKGYFNLEPEQKSLLRASLLKLVNATCPNCVNQVDMSRARFSVEVFAASLSASCQQVAQMIRNNTGRSPGELSTYEDLWRFTLVNYNAGVGCLNEAVDEVYQTGRALNWDNVKNSLDEACRGAIAYVEDIAAVEERPAAGAVIPVDAAITLPAPVVAPPAAEPETFIWDWMSPDQVFLFRPQR